MQVVGPKYSNRGQEEILDWDLGTDVRGKVHNVNEVHGAEELRETEVKMRFQIARCMIFLEIIQLILSISPYLQLRIWFDADLEAEVGTD